MSVRFQQAEALFHAALEFSPAERRRFLEEQTGADTELLASVYALLSAELASVVEEKTVATHFRRYGIYQTSELLGRGGMGSVYLAERADGQYTQKVALKVLAQHLSSDDFEARFLVERQLLAQLNHPNIVRLLDGGVSAEGEPFLVTELVDGEALDKYCDERKLGLRERILLFLQVCAAVEHAHQNLIVHRDLKPSNILVSTGGDTGQVKLLDFGTAKMLKSADAQTVTEVMLLTPRYASPEQLRKDAITTRSDVYSLGMILYELLSGRRAFGEGRDGVQELARAYQYSEATPLGTGISAQHAEQRSRGVRELESDLSGDLRAIVAKALEHNPLRRFASAREFADDLEAYLDSRPVKARPDTGFYRARKFVYRQRVIVAAAILILLAGAAGLVGTLKEKRTAERRFADVRRLAHYQIFDLYDRLLEVEGTTKLRAGMSEEALRYLGALSKEASGDESLKVELALGYLRVGDVTGNYSTQSLGRWKEAQETYQRGIDLLGKSETFAAKRARAMLVQGMTTAKYAADPSPENAKLIETTAKTFEQLLAQDARNPENYLRLGKAYAATARLRQNQRGVGGFVDLSEEHTRLAKQTFEKGLEFDTESRILLQALHQLAGERAGWIAQTKPQEALRWAGEEEMWRLRLSKDLRRSPLVMRNYASTLSSRGAALSALGEPQDALKELDQAVALFESLAKDEDNLAARMDLLASLNNRGLLQYELNLKQDYAKSFERTLQIAEAAIAKQPAPRFEEFRLKALYNLAYAYHELKDPRAAEFIPNAYSMLRKRAVDKPDDLVSRVYLADILLNLHFPGYERPDEALAYARQIVQKTPKELNGWELVAEAEMQQKHFAEAVIALEKGLECVPAPKPGEQPSRLYTSLVQRMERYRTQSKP